MVSEDSKVSHKRVIIFGAAAELFLVIVPANLLFGKIVDPNVLDVIKWVIFGGMGLTVADGIGKAMATAKGLAGTPDTIVNKTETTINT
jgi:hypothetical protein